MISKHSDNTDLELFTELIKKRCGLVVDNENNKALVNAIQSRMSIQSIESTNEYYNVLVSSIDETYRLVDFLTVNETYFFREIEHYGLFANKIFPELLEKKKGGKVKILSAGCSSGEEPCTIAISLVEKYGIDILKSVSIIGCDINQNILEKARQGIYGKYSFRGCSDALRDKYFTPQPSQHEYKLAEHIRNAVDYCRVNLLSDDYPEQIKDNDVVFYRNVSIYFKSDVQARIFKKLSGILVEGGYIFTSSTETFLHDIGILFLTEREGIYIHHKNIDIKVDDRRKYKTERTILTSPKIIPKQIEASSSTKTPPKNNPSASQDDARKTVNQELFDKALYAAMDKKYHDALTHIDTLLKNDLTFIKAYNLKASILMNLDRLAEAKEITRITLEIDQWNLECFIILGLIAKIECNNDEALNQFKTAVYVNPCCWLAHFYLGEVYNTTGAIIEARREYALAMKLMEKSGVADNGLSNFPLSFSVAQLIHLCKHNIAKLESYSQIRIT